MATFRLLQQLNRVSRFAQVTVEIATSSRSEVEVIAIAADAHRREAELGARWALRGLRHWYEGRRKPDAESLLHAWLFFEDAVPVGLRGSGDRLLLAKENPYDSYDMDEYGQTRVGPAQPPDVLSGFAGPAPRAARSPRLIAAEGNRQTNEWSACPRRHHVLRRAPQ